MSKILVNAELSLSIAADKSVEDIIQYMRDNGVKAGKAQIRELVAGKRDEVGGFYMEDAPVEETVVTAPVDGPKAADADVKPDFSDDAIQKAIDEAKEKGLEVITTKPVEEAKPKTERAPRAKAVIKASAPKGKIKAVRKGTKIAIGLELLLAGTTEADLAAAGVSDDVVDFVNRRVTKRGYGVTLVEGKLALALPEGVTAITYGGSAE